MNTSLRSPLTSTAALGIALLAPASAAAQAGTSSTATSSTATSSTATTSAPTASAPTATETATTSEHAPRATPRTPPPREEAEEPEGDGRDVDFLWLEAQGGVSTVNLVQFQNSNFAGGASSVFQEVSGTGPFVGVGAGFRVWWLAVGARMSFAGYDNFQIGTLGGEVTLRLPVPVFEPWVRVGAGYGWQGDASYADRSASTTVYGWAFQSGLGLDIYLANWFTLGAGVGLDILNMSRQSDPTASCMGATDICPQNPGDAVGYQLKGNLTLGLHF